MVFSSLEFLTFFLPAVILLYFIVPSRLQNGILLFFSLVFYAWGEPVYVLLMIFSIIANYFFGRGIHRFKSKPTQKRTVLVLAIIVNLALLGFFKYSNFAIDNLNSLLGLNIEELNLSLPIGISFFTFQAMSYVFDVYMDKAKMQANIFYFGLYISLFPQLIAGPIVRYSDVAEEINHRKPCLELASVGIRRFVIGLAKKVLLANNIGYVWSSLTDGSEPLSFLSAGLAALAFTFQIYFDFSGYSDMAIGLGKLFGFNFLENFNYPYISKSITEFWRRWHISLGTWFKEYVYIPLGGNRKGKAKQIRNILIVWLLTGLWHGASWNFVLWGLYYGICLLIEKLFLGKLLKLLPSIISRAYTMLVVIFGWIIFAFDNTAALTGFIKALLGFNGLCDTLYPFRLMSSLVLLVILTLGATPLPSRLGKRLLQKLGPRSVAAELLETGFLIVIFIISLAYLVDSTYNPFIYFRF